MAWAGREGIRARQTQTYPTPTSTPRMTPVVATGFSHVLMLSLVMHLRGVRRERAILAPRPRRLPVADMSAEASRAATIAARTPADWTSRGCILLILLAESLSRLYRRRLGWGWVAYIGSWHACVGRKESCLESVPQGEETAGEVIVEGRSFPICYLSCGGPLRQSPFGWDPPLISRGDTEATGKWTGKGNETTVATRKGSEREAVRRRSVLLVSLPLGEYEGDEEEAGDDVQKWCGRGGVMVSSQ